MSFSGFLIKLGSGNDAYTIPLKYMRAETYQITYSTLDLDSWRDSNGLLNRKALEHHVAKIEFNVPMMNNVQIKPLIDGIRAFYQNTSAPNQKKVSVTFYNPETDSYLTQNMYVPDIQFTIRNVDETNNIINYNETRIAFIGY